MLHDNPQDNSAEEAACAHQQTVQSEGTQVMLAGESLKRVVSNSSFSSSRAIAHDVPSVVREVRQILTDHERDMSRPSSLMLARMEQRLPDIQYYPKTTGALVAQLKMFQNTSFETSDEYTEICRDFYVLVAMLTSTGLVLHGILADLGPNLQAIQQRLAQLPSMPPEFASSVTELSVEIAEDREAHKTALKKMAKSRGGARKLFGSYKVREDDLKKFILPESYLKREETPIAEDKFSKTYEGEIIRGQYKGQRVHLKVYSEIPSGDVMAITERTIFLSHLLRSCENIARPRFAVPSAKVLVMDPTSHLTLEEVLKEDALTKLQKVDVTLAIAGALALVHSLDVIHRDIRSSNVLIVVTERKNHKVCLPKLTGFELCRIVDSDLSIGAREPGLVTNAPEIGTEHGTSFKTDVYAFGVLMYEISMGKRPTMSGSYVTEADVCKWRCEEHGILSEPFSNLMRACIDIDYQARPTMDEVAKRLAEVASELSDH